MAGDDLGDDDGDAPAEGPGHDAFEAAAERLEARLEDVTDDLSHVGLRIAGLLRQDFFSRDGYLIVLIMVVMTVVMLAVDDSFRGGEVVSAVMLGLLVLVTLSRSHVSHVLRVFGGVVTVSTVIAATVAAIQGRTPVTATAPAPHPIAYGAAWGTYTLLLALLFPAIIRQGFRHRRIDLNTVAAALAAYLLLGLIFASAYRFIEVVAPPMFNGHGVNSFTYVYFSYVTLTTVGYGDFTPANDAGRALAILEALFGQVFLVTIVALVVANLGRDHPMRVRDHRTDDDHDDHDDMGSTGRSPTA